MEVERWGNAGYTPLYTNDTHFLWTLPLGMTHHSHHILFPPHTSTFFHEMMCSSFQTREGEQYPEKLHLQEPTIFLCTTILFMIVKTAVS